MSTVWKSWSIPKEKGRGTGWQDAERAWIAKYRTTGEYLTNLTDGGDGTPGKTPSGAQRMAHSKRMKGRVLPAWQRAAMSGWHHSEQAKAAIARASAGRRHSTKARAAISKAAQGRDMTTCVRMSIKARTGVPLTAAHKAKIAATTTNRKPIQCVETGQVYPSITAASGALGVSEASVNQSARKGCHCKENHYRLL